MDKTEHDFKAPIEKTSVEIAKIILDNFIQEFNTFVYEDVEMTPEQEKDLRERGTDFGIKIMALVSGTDIPADYATYGIDKIIAALASIKQYVDGSIRQMHDEVLARTIGAKSPVTNTYAVDVATLGELMLAVNKTREATGGNPDDYFINKKSE